MVAQMVEVPLIVVVIGRTFARGVPSHKEYVLTLEGYSVEVLVQFRVVDDQVEVTSHVLPATVAFQNEADECRQVAISDQHCIAELIACGAALIFGVAVNSLLYTGYSDVGVAEK